MALLGAGTAFVVAAVVCAVAFVAGRRLNILDVPDDELKPHGRAVVPLGGVGVFAGLHAGLWVAGAFDPALLVATTVVWMLGLADDVFGLAPVTRLVGTATAGLALGLMSELIDRPQLLVLWVVATIVVVNAVNLLDGMDGLVGSVSILSVAGLWWFGVGQGTVGPHFYVVTIGAVGGFLVWNLRPARMFLGDNGAYVVGVSLTWLALRASPDGTAGLVALAIIGVPILDMSITVLRRLLVRQPLFSGDRDHTYDKLGQSGMALGLIVLAYVVVQALWGTVLNVISSGFADLVAAVIAALLGAALVSAIAIRQRSGRAV